MPAFHIKINSHVIKDLTSDQELSLSYKNTRDMQLFHPRSHSNSYSKFDLNILAHLNPSTMQRIVHQADPLYGIIAKDHLRSECLSKM
jgi:hypothetical protein